MGSTQLGRFCKCSHALIEQVFSDGSAPGQTKPLWSSWVVPKLCQVLEVPLWAVVDGLDPDERAALQAMTLVKTLAPERTRKFLDDMVERARDIAGTRGWEELTPDDDSPEGEPPFARRPRPAR
jgi:hypothetical protein